MVGSGHGPGNTTTRTPSWVRVVRNVLRHHIGGGKGVVLQDFPDNIAPSITYTAWNRRGFDNAEGVMGSGDAEDFNAAGNLPTH